MIIANSNALGSITPKAAPPVPEAAPMRPGKSAMAVGQLAKQAVIAARETGMELPKNAQGYAASQIAKGATPESIFAAQTSDDADVIEEPIVGETDINVPVSVDVAAVDPMMPQSEETAVDLMQEPEVDRAMLAAAQYNLASTVLAGSGDSSAQIALDLLS